MASKDYLPRIDAQFVIWFANFVGKVPQYKDTYGIKDDEINQYSADLTALKERLELIESTKKTLHSLVEGKDSMISDISKRIRTTAILVKRHKDYKAEDGENLGIIAPADMDEATLSAIAKPMFQALAMSNFVRLDWIKSAYDGVIIECKRGNETTFSRLSPDNRSPYEDARPNLQPDVPEIRVYRMRYILNEKEVGNWSDEVKVVVLI
ncbi:MAG: hypothetical protein HY960_06715 [Ignavibacteriae bacterium]|nr:hypothetical protein [Ignavibacteriota bacterium]